ncbi:hypothetical protein BV25DRAFT_1107118 [Artomyces pyxidatus]|uniref:Uncharacterized protein n=1 Tax=Artomyces pyxidatus TaxID=48021 RepID=A0ACB8TGC1_9AGAM|nr:hypothetical protein BV25DRAFT_1107118 [Artomyces pyxidatus]
MASIDPTMYTRSLRTNVAYELPPTVKSLNEGWIATCQSAATVSGLFAAVEAHLLVFVKNPSNYTNSPRYSVMQALLIFTYSALFFSLSATISSLVLTDEFGELPVRASRKSNPVKQGTFDSSAASLLEVYGARKSWRWVMWHWLFTLIAALICVVVQILLYVWLEESVAVRVTVLCVGVFGILPLLHFLPHTSGSKRNSFVVSPTS